MIRTCSDSSARHRVAQIVLVATAALAAVGCGDDDDAKPVAKKDLPTAPTAAVVADQPSADPGIAALQDKLKAWRSSSPPRLDTTKKDWRLSLPLRPIVTFDPSKTYFWTLHTTQGPIRVRLLTKKAPKHASNIAYLTLIGFYDSLTLHKVLPGKIIEGGCPIGDGLGTPGYGLEPEYGTEDENAHSRRGIVASTGVGGNTDDCKFRILLAPDPSLDKFSTVFGEVVESDDVLKKIEALGDEKGYPKTRVEITKAEIGFR